MIDRGQRCFKKGKKKNKPKKTTTDMQKHCSLTPFSISFGLSEEPFSCATRELKIQQINSYKVRPLLCSLMWVYGTMTTKGSFKGFRLVWRKNLFSRGEVWPWGRSLGRLQKLCPWGFWGLARWSQALPGLCWSRAGWVGGLQGLWKLPSTNLSVIPWFLD